MDMPQESILSLARRKEFITWIYQILMDVVDVPKRHGHKESLHILI